MTQAMALRWQYPAPEEEEKARARPRPHRSGPIVIRARSGRISAPQTSGSSQFTTIEVHGGYAFGHRSQRIGFLQRLYELDQAGQDQALAFMYDKVDRLLERREFTTVNRLLSEVELDAVHPALWVGMLTITVAARSKLPQRDWFALCVQKKLRALGKDPDRVLKGLI